MQSTHRRASGSNIRANSLLEGAIAAQAMGTTEVKLNELLKAGQVMSKQFLPEFGKQLQSEFGERLGEAIAQI